MSERLRKRVQLPATWPWALAGLIIGTPLAIISPPLVLILLAVSGTVGFFLWRRNNTHAAAIRLLAAFAGLLVPTVVYWIIALTQINS